ncbi:IEC3 subunit of the Ino80 complex, chromatin re-modelling-domain-containing protein [Xylaria bambusicola]|uniref:IEC3 subunit of the Ino80 complex, chromatin re-modelling-domain-containing protein n=1 Tax=Xylaria bambusicola TaxID=326684 RepID=UPI002007F561|nr:IEC3 subunit of the Ino80 complex, chromatin re-modelling-domain-containing protein [Xylaria bambusicola]KAI0521815.1 IEC3 subunit of the Ino80 complex, chromatin re-modelling-domain-containing protein [Xylaria bambusicola]
MDFSGVKTEPGLRDRLHDDAQTTDARPSYKSWKKKYRKMRITFDQRMRESEDLHSLELKAMQTAKRLAIENDRLMDMLLDINESPQIPFERRIDLNLEDEEDDEDDETESDDSDTTQKPTKSLRKLIQEVPHQSYEEYVQRFPELQEDLEPEDPQTYPTSFLSADDLDEYLYKLDMRLGIKTKPSLAPSALGTTTVTPPPANFALRNPTSVYNWLRRNAPKTFLQDLEKDKDKDDREKEDGRKRKGGASRKRQSTAGRKEKEKDTAEPMDWDDEAGYDAPAATTLKGKRKRDDDGGYRPKGGSSRPTKKRKSKDLSEKPAKTTKGRKSLG